MSILVWAEKERIEISVEELDSFAKELKSHPGVFLEDMVAIHRLEKKKFEIRYRFASYRDSHSMTAVVQLADAERLGDARGISIAHYFATAAWLESEISELFGIRFSDRATTRTILPESWDGYPMRKDYRFRGEGSA